MAIQTIEFGITPIEYYKIVATNRLKRSWWVYIGCFALAMISISDFGVKDLSTFLVIFGFIYPPLIFVYLYFWTTSSKNKSAFIKRQLTIDSDKIISVDQDKARNEVLWKYVIQIVKRRSYWLLYISKGQFIYISKTAFQSDTDLNEFEKLIKTLPKIGKHL